MTGKSRKDRLAESMARMALSSEYSRISRVEFAAVGRMDKHGRAEFGRGELAYILSIDGKPAEHTIVSQAIATAKKRGVITAESNVRCLIVDHAAVPTAEGVFRASLMCECGVMMYAGVGHSCRAEDRSNDE